MDKWICNKCNFMTSEQPKGKNSTCISCGKGRYKIIKKCECGKEFHPQTYKAKYCSMECKNRFMPKGGKKGKKYPHTQRARIATCPVCNKEFRAVNDYKDRLTVYCSKFCWSNRGKKYKKITRTPEFRKWKSAVFKRDNYTCQNCGNKKNLEAHHIKEKKNFPELEYEINNGICLCHDCHKETSNYGYKARKNLTGDTAVLLENIND